MTADQQRANDLEAEILEAIYELPAAFSRKHLCASALFVEDILAKIRELQLLDHLNERKRNQ